MLKVRVGIYVRWRGRETMKVLLFPSEKEAEDYARKDDNPLEMSQAVFGDILHIGPPGTGSFYPFSVWGVRSSASMETERLKAHYGPEEWRKLGSDILEFQDDVDIATPAGRFEKLNHKRHHVDRYGDLGDVGNPVESMEPDFQNGGEDGWGGEEEG